MRLLAIHAHPDDESSKGAATTAKYAALGHEVLVLTCTGGERGDILNPAMDRPGILENIAEVRREEMARAARALGVDHHWLGYTDSGLPGGDPRAENLRELLPEDSFALVPDDTVAQDVVEVIRQFKPHVIITYDENGGYPHPDHLMVHRASMIAWEKAGDPGYHPELGAAWQPSKLYYTHGFVYQRMKLFHDLIVSQGRPSPFSPMISRWEKAKGDIMDRVTTQVECAEYFPHRERALISHATQIDPAGAFLVTPVSVQQRLWPTEEFELAKTRVPVVFPETDLFAGIDGTAKVGIA